MDRLDEFSCLLLVVDRRLSSSLFDCDEAAGLRAIRPHSTATLSAALSVSRQCLTVLRDKVSSAASGWQFADFFRLVRFALAIRPLIISSTWSALNLASSIRPMAGTMWTFTNI